MLLGLLALCALAAPGLAQDRPDTGAARETNNEGQPAAEATDERQAARVAELLSALSSRSLAEREEAQEALEALGPELLDHLPDDLSALPAEARSRLERLRGRLETERARQAAEPSPVSLSVSGTLGDALDALESQTGNRIVGRIDRDTPVELAIDDTTFWPAFDAVLDAAGYEVDPYGGEPNALSIRPRPEEAAERSATVEYTGVFRISIAEVVARRDFVRPDLSSLRVGLNIAWEPRLTPITLTLPSDRLVAETEAGERLHPPSSAGSLEASTSAELSQVELNVPLPPVERSSGALRRLAGQIRATLPGEHKVFRFDLADAAQEEDATERTGGVTVRVEQVRPNGALHEIRLRVEFSSPGMALESHRQWVFDNPVAVVDEDGERRHPLGIEVYGRSGQHIGITYLFDLGESVEGMQLEYETPATLIQSQFEFELEDIPLP